MDADLSGAFALLTFASETSIGMDDGLSIVICAPRHAHPVVRSQLEHEHVLFKTDLPGPLAVHRLRHPVCARVLLPSGVFSFEKTLHKLRIGLPVMSIYLDVRDYLRMIPDAVTAGSFRDLCVVANHCTHYSHDALPKELLPRSMGDYAIKHDAPSVGQGSTYQPPSSTEGKQTEHKVSTQELSDLELARHLQAEFDAEGKPRAQHRSESPFLVESLDSDPWP